MISMMLEDWVGRIVLLFILALCGLIPFVIVQGVKESERWQAFKEEHHCVIVERVLGESSTMPLIQSNGQMGFAFHYTAPKVAWKCDDGITYWR